jgi:hypothetical protein
VLALLRAVLGLRQIRLRRTSHTALRYATFFITGVALKTADCTSIISLIIAAGALVFSIYSYYKQSKSKKIQDTLNELLIHKYNKELSENKSNIDCKIFKNQNKSCYTLKFKNTGEIAARNISLDFISDPNWDIYNVFPISELHSQDEIDIDFNAYLDMKSHFAEAKISWSDSYGSNEKIIILSLV